MARHSLVTPLSICAWQPHWHILLVRREAPSLNRHAAYGAGNQATLIAPHLHHTSHALQLCRLMCPTRQVCDFNNRQIPRLLQVRVQWPSANRFNQYAATPAVLAVPVRAGLLRSRTISWNLVICRKMNSLPLLRGALTSSTLISSAPLSASLLTLTSTSAADCMLPAAASPCPLHVLHWLVPYRRQSKLYKYTVQPLCHVHDKLANK